MSMVDTLNGVIAEHHDEKHANDGMVYQVWEDGEVTLQKGGELLWQRNLHVIYFGDTAKAIHPDRFPCKTQGGKHGYIFTNEAGVKAVRAAMGFDTPRSD